MTKIETVSIYHSSVNYHNGEDIGPGFGVILDPHPTSEGDVFKIAQAISSALEGLVLNDESQNG